MWYKKYAVDEYMCQAKESIKDSWWCTAINDLQYGNVLSARIFSRKPENPVKIPRMKIWISDTFFADIKTWAIVVVILLSLFLVFDLIALFGTSKVRTLSIDVSWQRKEKQKVLFSILLSIERPAEKRKDGKSSKRTLKYCSGMLKISHNVILQFLSLLQNSCKEKFCITTTAEFNLAKGGHGKSCLV